MSLYAKSLQTRLLFFIFITLLFSQVVSAAENKAYLRSVLLLGNNVYASNQDGLFCASKTTKKWQKLPTPKEMPLAGVFANEDPKSHDIYYYRFKGMTIDINHNQFSENDKWVYGLYLSQDNGKTWKLICKDYYFTYLYLHPDGTLYAISTDKNSSKSARPKESILMSIDHGSNWKDITGDAKNYELFSIRRDPDNPSLVIIDAHDGIRGYILQASDENYQWKATRTPFFEDEHPKENFFSHPYPVIYTPYHRSATLDDYFQYNFGPYPDIPGIYTATTKPSYKFKTRKPKVVQVSVQFISGWGDAATILDTRDDYGFWGLRIEDPKGIQSTVGLSIYETWRYSQSRDEYAKSIRDSKELISTKIISGKPYTREIDLEKLYGFSEKGKYTVQIAYNASQIADDKKGEFDGNLTSPTFTVTIK